MLKNKTLTKKGKKMKKIMLSILVGLFALTNNVQAKDSISIVFAGSATGSVNRFNADLGKELSQWYDIKEVPGGSTTKGIKIYNDINGVALLYTRGALHNANSKIKGEKDQLDINSKNILISLEVYDMVCVAKGKGSAGAILATKGASMNIGMSDSGDKMKMFVEKLNSATGSKNKLIPFKGSEEITQGLITGELDVGVTNPISAAKGVSAGTIDCDTSTNPVATKETKALADIIKTKWFGWSDSKHYMIIVKNADAKLTQELKSKVESLVKDQNSLVGKSLSDAYAVPVYKSSGELYKIYKTAKNNKVSYSK